MLKRVWAVRWYVLLGGLTFIVTLALTAPMHWVWRFVAPQLTSVPVKISQVRGTLWRGQLQLTVPQLAELGSISGHWRLQVLPLLIGQARLHLALENADLRLELPLVFSRNQLQITAAEGYFDLRPLKPLLARERGSAEGNVELHQFNTRVQFTPLQLTDLHGRLNYSGGAVSLLVENQPVAAQLPPLVGDLSFNENKGTLMATTLENKTLFSGYVQNDGWAGLEIRRNFIDALGQTWPMQAEPDTVVFEVSRKVF